MTYYCTFFFFFFEQFNHIHYLYGCKKKNWNYLRTSKNEDKIKFIVGVYFNLKLIDINKNVLIHFKKLVLNHFTECLHCTIIYFGF